MKRPPLETLEVYNSDDLRRYAGHFKFLGIKLPQWWTFENRGRGWRIECKGALIQLPAAIAYCRMRALQYLDWPGVRVDDGGRFHVGPDEADTTLDGTLIAALARRCQP